ncbi:Uncharacterised protein [Chromobacterium violaceum]|uniref:Uncharacterized protein n=1 Tax=Chromobacterium violaceum TaxID=536 RepID=A0AAX2M536_CHRVL|nr:Uncharacterised protein [Chromobacterium violaceum]SUX31442.1 Uncharacterised protein [Chromobacterium violaceum]
MDKQAAKAGITLCQNCNRLAPKRVPLHAIYLHAKQDKRMRNSLKKLKVLVGRVLV